MSIYLFINGEANGPHSADALESFLSGPVEEADDAFAAGGVTKLTLASTEGMKEGRSIREAIVWERGRMLGPYKQEVLAMAKRMLATGADLRCVRNDLRSLSASKGLAADSATIESLAIIVDVNFNLLRSFSQFAYGEMQVAPACELLRYSPGPFPRDWSAAWSAAGGKSFAGRMVARKDDQVWTALSDFGLPFPPFSIDTGISVEEVLFADACNLGVVKRDEAVFVPPCERRFEVVGILN